MRPAVVANAAPGTTAQRRFASHSTSMPRLAALPSLLAAVLASLLSPPSVSAQTFLPGFSQTTVASGISNATAMSFAPDGRIFVSEQGGTLRVVKDGALLATPFLTVPGVSSAGERGLLGVAFDPDFATNNHVYVYYTHNNGSQTFNRLSRFTANGNTAVAGSEVVLMNLEPLSGATNHNGGAVHFGPDGKLYVGVGENANAANAQTLNNRLGKILRLNPDGSIPTDNPFYNVAVGDNRAIWALGLRNPFTFAFQPGTGLMYINDVGQSAWEEVNVGRAGANYGWGSGGGANEGPFDPAAFPEFSAPRYAYTHGSGPDQGFSIAGGAFYNPASLLYPASFAGDYFYADFVNGWIRTLDAGTDNSSFFASGLGNIVDLRVWDDGALYYLARDSGTIRRIGADTAAVVPETSTAALALLGLMLLLTGPVYRLSMKRGLVRAATRSRGRRSSART